MTCSMGPSVELKSQRESTSAGAKQRWSGQVTICIGGPFCERVFLERRPRTIDAVRVADG